MTSRNEYAATGMAILSSMVLGDREGFMALTEDLEPAQVIGYLGRSAELVVNVLAQALQVSKEEALRIVAMSVAVVDQDD
ncbi:hypothetical protein [Microbacterium sp. AG790]|uniref:hypothetical protein n=1 Tax=Microbacterium sp. AG790 TaxID=2183995 RepID=UPI0011C41271|nr:hypothetical protein [Microbacterium sp. AG790]